MDEATYINRLQILIINTTVDFIKSGPIQDFTLHTLMAIFAVVAIVPHLYLFMRGKEGIEGLGVWAIKVVVIKAFADNFVVIAGALFTDFGNIGDHVQVIAFGNANLVGPYNYLLNKLGGLSWPSFSVFSIAQFAWKFLWAGVGAIFATVFLMISLAYSQLANFVALVAMTLCYISIPTMLVGATAWVFLGFVQGFIGALFFIVIVRWALAMGVKATGLSLDLISSGPYLAQFNGGGDMLMVSIGLFIGLAIALSPLILAYFLLRGAPTPLSSVTRI